MKKFSLYVAAVLCCSFLAGCEQKKPDQKPAEAPVKKAPQGC